MDKSTRTQDVVMLQACNTQHLVLGASRRSAPLRFAVMKRGRDPVTDHRFSYVFADIGSVPVDVFREHAFHQAAVREPASPLPLDAALGDSLPWLLMEKQVHVWEPVLVFLPHLEISKGDGVLAPRPQSFP